MWQEEGAAVAAPSSVVLRVVSVCVCVGVWGVCEVAAALFFVQLCRCSSSTEKKRQRGILFCAYLHVLLQEIGMLPG
jgi:hypothetical protein